MIILPPAFLFVFPSSFHLGPYFVFPDLIEEEEGEMEKGGEIITYLDWTALQAPVGLPYRKDGQRRRRKEYLALEMTRKIMQ